MEELSLDSSVLFKATFKGKSYDLREPTVDEVMAFQKRQDGDGDNVDLFKDFLDQMGLPKSVSGAIGITKMEALTEKLIGGIKKK